MFEFLVNTTIKKKLDDSIYKIGKYDETSRIIVFFEATYFDKLPELLVNFDKGIINSLYDKAKNLCTSNMLKSRLDKTILLLRLDKDYHNSTKTKSIYELNLYWLDKGYFDNMTKRYNHIQLPIKPKDFNIHTLDKENESKYK